MAHRLAPGLLWQQPSSSSLSCPSQPFRRRFSSAPQLSVWVQKRIHVKLRVDHPRLGKAGKVIRVKPGHMRQQLYPSGVGLYCAKDGVPIHHFQPPPSPNPPSVPPPGLSRPIAELIERLGCRINLSKKELRAAQNQVTGWIHDANPHLKPNKASSSTPLKSTPQSSSSAPVIPDGFLDCLRQVASELLSAERPIVTLTRPGPENSDSLYSSVRPEEVMGHILEELTRSDPLLQSTDLSKLLKLDGCEISSESHLPAAGPRTTQPRPIKVTGRYDVTLSINEAVTSDCQMFHFIVQVTKNSQTQLIEETDSSP